MSPSSLVAKPQTQQRVSRGRVVRVQYTKGKLINDGGEGYIYETIENPNLLMKIYKEKDSSGSAIVTPELHSKLEYMKNNPPEALINRGVVAWPLELLTDEQGRLTGFIMPRMDFDEHIQRTYCYRHPLLEAEEYQRFPSVESRIKIAMNLCSALNELHRKEYVFGDLNHHNVGVNYTTGQISFMDCDSFHISDANGKTFRTNVIMTGYLAPEIIRHCNKERADGKDYNLDKVSLPTFTIESDLFCLSVHIFKLLMNGVSPFLGVKADAIGSTASPFVGNDAIERNAYVFREGNKPSAVFCLPAESFPFEVITLFNRAFMDGVKVPFLRPYAASWYNALNRYLSNDLTQCPREVKHQYYKQLPACPYCAADDRHQATQETMPVQPFKSEFVDLPILPIQKQAVVQSPPKPQQPAPPSPPTANTAPTPRPIITRTFIGTSTSNLDIIRKIRHGETRNLQFGKDTWRVLVKIGDEALLLTENLIERKQYSNNVRDVTWESCTLREYLNTDFFETSFSSKERAAVIEAFVGNDNNLWHGTRGGRDTLDYVFLLSLEESDLYFGDSGNYRNKIMFTTSHFSNKNDKDRALKKQWWLRSPGVEKWKAACVSDNGYVYVNGNCVIDTNYVRPALWLSLE